MYLDVFSDSDWAGDKKTRRSTSGGVASICGGGIKSWASTQGSIALSSGEAEYYAMVKAAAEGLGIQTLMRDLGWEVVIRIWVDSTAAKAVASRIGLGKIRHMEVRYLWAQEAHKRNRFIVRKIAGVRNPADVVTKPLSVSEMSCKLESVGAFVVKRSNIYKFWPKGGKREAWADVEDSDLEEIDLCAED